MSKQVWTIVNTPEHYEIARTKTGFLAVWYWLKERQSMGKTGVTRQEMLEKLPMSEKTIDRVVKEMYSVGLLVNAVPQGKLATDWISNEAK